MGELCHFHLATCEVAHVQRSHPISAREGCGLLSRVGNERLGLWEKLYGRRSTDQVMEPGFIQQQLLVRGAPEDPDLLFLAPGCKGLLLPASHSATARRETPSCSASPACVKPMVVRSVSII